ncbi:MAG: hypothetical protein GY811_08910, partial [Myxococcales bacterium]|nr:hypothetical protein [Myxococcales bacterium]
MEPNGRGDGPSASSLKDEVGNRSTPSDFSLGQLKHGNEATDLYHVLVAGVEGTPMLPATLVMTREMGEQVDAKRYLPSSDLNAAKSFASSLMPSDE